MYSAFWILGELYPFSFKFDDPKIVERTKYKEFKPQQ